MRSSPPPPSSSRSELVEPDWLDDMLNEPNDSESRPLTFRKGLEPGGSCRELPPLPLGEYFLCPDSMMS